MCVGGLFSFVICMSVLPAYIFGTTSVPGALEGQKRMLDPLELELQAMESYRVGAGSPIRAAASGH